MEFIIYTLIVSLLLAFFCAILGKHFGYGFFAATIAAIIIVSNVIGGKLIDVWIFTFSLGSITYAISFVLTDILSEYWGFRKTRNVIFIGLFSTILYLIIIQLAIYVTPSSFYENQAAFQEVFSSSWRIVLATIATYTVAQLNDLVIYHYLKKKTRGKHLWLRNNVSTWISQSIDSVIFYSIAFYGVFPLGMLILSAIVAKVIIALLDTPIIYLVRSYYGKDFKPKEQ